MCGLALTLLAHRLFIVHVFHSVLHCSGLRAHRTALHKMHTMNCSPAFSCMSINARPFKTQELTTLLSVLQNFVRQGSFFMGLNVTLAAPGCEQAVEGRARRRVPEVLGGRQREGEAEAGSWCSSRTVEAGCRRRSCQNKVCLKSAVAIYLFSQIWCPTLDLHMAMQTTSEC